MVFNGKEVPFYCLIVVKYKQMLIINIFTLSTRADGRRQQSSLPLIKTLSGGDNDHFTTPHCIKLCVDEEKYSTGSSPIILRSVGTSSNIRKWRYWVKKIEGQKN